MSVYVVVPSYNEAENIGRLVSSLRLAQPGMKLILVDDGSPDGTADLARSLSDGDIEVLEREGKQGLASAYFVGFRRALELGAERIIQMDADLSHDPADVPRLGLKVELRNLGLFVVLDGLTDRGNALVLDELVVAEQQPRQGGVDAQGVSQWLCTLRANIVVAQIELHRQKAQVKW